VVQLVKGTYVISSQITVYGFQGSFVGAGQGVTIIEAPYSLPPPEYNTAAAPYRSVLPGPSNPWPNLFTFVGGSFSIYGMTITVPNPLPISSPGWYCPCAYSYSTSLLAAIEVTGGEYLTPTEQQSPQVSANIDHVTVVGASGGDSNGNNLWSGILYAGEFLPPDWTNAITQVILISGTFSLTNSVFNAMGWQGGPWVDAVEDATVTICYNTAVNNPGFTYGFFDSYASTLTFCGNKGSADMYTNVMLGQQDVDVPSPPGALPSTVFVTGNNFYASQGASAVALFSGGVPFNAVVSGNMLTTDSTCTPTLQAEGWCYNYPTPEWYSAVVVAYGLSNVDVSHNIIFGGGAGSTRVPASGIYIAGGPGQVSGNIITGSYNGVWVDTATDVQVTHNTVLASANYGIALTDTSSSNVIAHNVVMHSVVDDLYWDGTGSNNQWCGNVYTTSSPSGLTC